MTYLWLAGNEGMEKRMETTIMGSTGTTIRIHWLAGNEGMEKKMETTSAKSVLPLCVLRPVGV